MARTPGPWINDDGLVSGGESRARFAPGVSVDIFDANEWPNDLRDEAMANAALIAAAPEMYVLIEEFGDVISDMFEQMIRGHWVDDHGHDVQLNQKMIALKPLIIRAIALRAPIIKAEAV